MLLKAHGNKLLPVDNAQVAKQRRQQANYEAKHDKARSNAVEQGAEDPNEQES